MRRSSQPSAFGLALAGLVALTLCGCFQLEQKLLLNGDGSMVVNYHYSVATDSEALLSTGAGVIQGWQRRDPGGAAWFTNEETVRQHFKAGGAQLKRYRSYEEAGRRHVELMVFAEAGPKALNAGSFGPLRCVRLPDGRVRLLVELPSVPSKADGLSAEALAALAQDLRLSFEISVPGDIVEATAPTHTRTSVRWEFDPAKDTSFLRSTPRLACTFEARHLAWAASLPAAAR
jgi:hypothetical protein